jgi:hypothetical protein
MTRRVSTRALCSGCSKPSEPYANRNRGESPAIVVGWTRHPDTGLLNYGGVCRASRPADRRAAAIVERQGVAAPPLGRLRAPLGATPMTGPYWLSPHVRRAAALIAERVARPKVRSSA